MDRQLFHKQFSTPGVVVLPVIHVMDEAQARRNAEIAIAEGVRGIFFINHDFPKEILIPIVRSLKLQSPSSWIGVNFLGVKGEIAFPILGELARDGANMDAYWADDARIDEQRGEDSQPEAEAAQKARSNSGWNGLYFGGTAFKKQRQVPADNLAAAARIASRYMDVVTTSGVATGVPADVSKLELFRSAVGEAPLALASGVTADNAVRFAHVVDAFLVATGINYYGDFYNIDPARLRHLLSVCQATSSV